MTSDSDPVRILVHQIGQLGDTIVSIPAIRAIREYFGPSARIHILHDVQGGGLVTSDMVLASTGVDDFIPYPFSRSSVGKIRGAARLWYLLRGMRFDAVVSVLPSDRPAKSLKRDRLFFRLCGISRIIGFDAIPHDTVHPCDHSGRATATSHEAVFRLERLHAHGILRSNNGYFRLPMVTVDPRQSKAASEWLRARRRHPEFDLIAICPGCKKSANAWPTDRFVEIGRRMLAGSHAELIVMGGPAERGMAEEVIAQWGGEGLLAAGEFSVTGSAAVLEHCKLMIGLDTGTTHLAAAVGVPCLVIQSANSSPGHWDPLGEGHSIIRHSVPCAGCLHHDCPVEGHPCMRDITVDEVWESVQQVMSKHRTVVP